MIRFYLDDVEIQKWVGERASDAVMRKFIEKTADRLTVVHQPELEDDPDVTFTSMGMRRLPMGIYAGFTAKWHPIPVAVTETEVLWGGVNVYQTLDRRYVHVKDEHVQTFRSLLSSVENRHVRVYAQPFVMEQMLGEVVGFGHVRMQVEMVHAPEQPNSTLFGTLDLDRGIIVPWPRT